MELEMIRQRLVREGADFNTVDAFRQLDKDAKGEVDMQTLKQSLTQEIQINDFTPEKLALFFGRFDKLKRSKIKYS